MGWEFNVRPVLTGVNLDGVSVAEQGILLKLAASLVMGSILDNWPIDTGKSVAGFRTTKRGSDWWVTNAVDYTEYVRDGLVDGLAEAGLVAAKPRIKAAAKNVREGKAPDRPGRRRRSDIVPRQATAVRIEANQTRDALRIVGPLVESGELPKSAAALVRRGQLVRAGRALRAAGLRREAALVEQISRRGRQV